MERDARRPNGGVCKRGGPRKTEGNRAAAQSRRVSGRLRKSTQPRARSRAVQMPRNARAGWLVCLFVCVCVGAARACGRHESSLWLSASRRSRQSDPRSCGAAFMLVRACVRVFPVSSRGACHAEFVASVPCRVAVLGVRCLARCENVPSAAFSASSPTSRATPGPRVATPAADWTRQASRLVSSSVATRVSVATHVSVANARIRCNARIQPLYGRSRRPLGAIVSP